MTLCFLSKMDGFYKSKVGNNSNGFVGHVS